MEIKTTGKQFIDEIPYGVYVWEMPDGRLIGDDAGNILSISAKKYDIRRINELAEAVKTFGITEGQAKFMSGVRKIDDEEYERQKAQFAEGQIPDWDIPALVEEARARKREN